MIWCTTQVIITLINLRPSEIRSLQSQNTCLFHLVLCNVSPVISAPRPRRYSSSHSMYTLFFAQQLFLCNTRPQWCHPFLWTPTAVQSTLQLSLHLPLVMTAVLFHRDPQHFLPPIYLIVLLTNSSSASLYFLSRSSVSFHVVPNWW